MKFQKGHRFLLDNPETEKVTEFYLCTMYMLYNFVHCVSDKKWGREHSIVRGSCQFGLWTDIRMLDVDWRNWFRLRFKTNKTCENTIAVLSESPIESICLSTKTFIKALNGNWADFDGNALTYTNWHTGLPDNANGNEKWVHFGTSGKWNDVPGDRAQTHIFCVKPTEKGEIYRPSYFLESFYPVP